MEELKIIEERKLQERLQLESMIQKEKEYIKKGIVTRRSDDPYGQGFGFVKTGYVSSQKLSILERAASVERTVSPTWSTASSKGAKGLRVTWAESPGSSRPGSKMSGTDKVAEFEALALQSETPPLAGEWAVSKGMESQAYSQKSVISSQASSKSIVQQSQSSSSSSMAAEVSNKIAVKESPEKVAQIDAPVVPSETLPSVGELALNKSMESQAFSQKSAISMSSQSSNKSQSSSASSMAAVHDSSLAVQSASTASKSQTSAFSSSFKSESASQATSTMASFKSSSVKTSSSSFMKSSQINTFEAFPGMGGIENLNLEGEKPSNFLMQ